jgi:hypothetical protein
VAVVIVLLALVFTRHSNSDQNCIPASGSDQGQLNCP